MHQPRWENTHADALSQQPNYLKGIKPISHTILDLNKEKHMIINWQVNINATLTLQPLDIENQIKEGYKTNVMAQNILTNKPANFNIMQNGLIEYKDLIYVSNRHVQD